MLYCYECGNTFNESESDYFYDRSEFWGAIRTDRVQCCPFCGSSNIDNLEGQPHCSGCGEVCIHDYIQTCDDKYYCSECYLKYDIND